MRVKIYGAGSIGNHLANASRQLDWQVDIYDINKEALDRTKNQIYPQRYGAWDHKIGLYEINDDVSKDYDLIIIGTPPDSHVNLAISAIDQKPKGILIEKPLSTPDLENLNDLVAKARLNNVRLFIGYDHIVGNATSYVSQLNSTGEYGQLKTIDVDFREHWGGIFAAHPWLSGPKDSYLGFWKRGGGATGEHSHGINLWQYFSHITGNGRIISVSSNVTYDHQDKLNYDSIALVNVKTETGLSGRIAQDVVTCPPIKKATLIYEKGIINWHCSLLPGQDHVKTVTVNNQETSKDFFKTRPEDFICELRHIEISLQNNTESPLDIVRGIETMLVIAAVHKSALNERNVHIDYSRGYSQDALEC